MEELSQWQINVLCELDRLKHLIDKVKEKGQYTNAERYEKYYDEVRTRPKFKELIKGTIHDNNQI